MNRKPIVLAAIALATAGAAAGCSSQADTVSKNLSKDAEKFQVQRRIVGVNGVTDKVEFEVEGKCSVEGDGLGDLRVLTITCKQGPRDYRKHFIGLSDNVFFMVTQLKGVPVSEYRTKWILKPQQLVPDVDLVTG